MIVWPKVEKYVPVSTTIRPVTHTAEVAVNNASIKDKLLPFCEEMGSINKKAPHKIKLEKLIVKTW